MNKLDKTELFNKAMKLHDEGKLDEADKIYQSVLKDDADNFVANYFHGCVLSEKSQFQDAIKYLKKALNFKPDNYEANNNLGIVYKKLNDYRNAKECFLKAISIDENNFRAYFNCANLYFDEKEYDQAIEFFNKTITHNDSFGEVYHLLGVTYQEQYKIDRNTEHLIKARDYFKSAIMYNPSNPDPLSALGKTFLWSGDIKEANKLFKKVCLLKYSDKIIFSKYIERYLSNKDLLPVLIKHEYEQLTFIKENANGADFLKLEKKYYDELKKLYSKIKNGDFKIEDVTHPMKIKISQILCNDPPKESLDDFVNKKNNISSLESEYLSKVPELVVIDNFLNEEVVTELQKFCLNANIFKYPYKNGYLGAFLSGGLSNEFVLKLSEDVRLTFKNIFKDLKLIQAWIYKYDNTEKGISVHADQAKVNLNFWITPDQANLDSTSGGLKIWNKVPPEDWGFDNYNSDLREPEINKFLSENKATKRIVPYRGNRAVLFNSKLLHATDDLNFKDNHEDRRINVTFLYD